MLLDLNGLKEGQWAGLGETNPVISASCQIFQNKRIRDSRVSESELDLVRRLRTSSWSFLDLVQKHSGKLEEQSAATGCQKIYLISNSCYNFQSPFQNKTDEARPSCTGPILKLLL